MIDVSHDQTKAMKRADKVVVLRDGEAKVGNLIEL